MADEQGAVYHRWRMHADRDALLAEAHARPFAPVAPPMLATRVATLSGQDGAEADRAHMAALCRKLGRAEPGPAANWCALDAGSWRLRWERHTEFSTWTCFRPPVRRHAFTETAFDLAPVEWVSDMPGEVLVATTVELGVRDGRPSAAGLFGADAVGARLSDGAATVFTDFRPDATGMTRFLLLDESGDAVQAGRLMLGLLEIETYRLMALLAFPVAGIAREEVKRIEDEAATLAAQLADDAEPEKDRQLLARLAALAGRAEALSARTNFRFGAARAYHSIVQDRIEILGEQRVDGMQTLGAFMERRLAPAMRTCDSVAARQQAAIERIARTEQMLNTRVQVAAEAASVALLASMDRRAVIQLRLQRTVEGLSVAAISYYAVGLLSYLLKAAEHERPTLDAVLWSGLATPLVVATIWLMMRAHKRRLEADEH